MAFFKKLKQAVKNLSVGDWCVIGGTVLTGVVAVATGGVMWVVALSVVATGVIVVGELIKAYEKNPVPSLSYA